MGYVVRPLTSCAVTVPTSAVRGAKCCAISGVAGFVVLSRRTSAVRCERGPSGRATVPTTKPGEWIARSWQRRYGRASNGRAATVRDKTTKPPRQAGSWRCAPRTADARTRTEQSDQGHHHVTIGSCSFDALQADMAKASQHSGPYDASTAPHKPDCSAPGRAAFFSLVFFAGQRKVTGSPRRGMSYGSWVQQPTPQQIKAKSNSKIQRFCPCAQQPTANSQQLINQ